MGVPLDLIERMQNAGLSREDIQAIIDNWNAPVPGVSETSQASQPSRGALRQRRWRERKEASQSVSKASPETSPGGTIGGGIISFENKKNKTPHSPSKQDIEVREFFDGYNICAKELGWAVAAKLDRRRAAGIRRCIEDAGGLEHAFDHLNDLANSKHGKEFGAGQNDRDWRIDIDYVIRKSKWVQIIEGKFNGVQAQR